MATTEDRLARETNATVQKGARVLTPPARTRPTTPSDQEADTVQVWPHLVVIEFLAAIIFTINLVLLSTLVNGPLDQLANPDVTPNPSKAPWYFLNLQELLLHMNPALAGVVVPTVFLIILAAVPYIDRSQEGQGTWFGTLNAVRISVWSGIFSFVGTLTLILYDQGKHAQLYEIVSGKTYPVGKERPGWLPDVGIITAGWDLLLSRNLRSIQT